ncbi:MAG: nucleotidyltransferase family protein [Candidatus Moranbacteria bacterium]|nr:nucleotidyltransferase family protein [Candidatus Moranbacteria bacterium]
MQIVILAAGRGTRMKDLTDSVPKPMLEIKGKPILAYKIEALPEKVEEVIFVVGYLGGQIQEYFGDSYAGKKISYVVQEQLNGTGGAVQLVKDLIKDDFLLMMADDLYMKKDVEKLMHHDLAMLGLEVDDPKKFGIIYLNKDGNLKNIIEKPDISGPAFANIALYKLNKKFFDYPMTLSERGEYEIIQPISSMAQDFSFHVEKATDWFPIGNPEDLKKAEDIIDKFI